MFEEEEDGDAKDGEVDGAIEIESEEEEAINEEGEEFAAETVEDEEEATEELEPLGAVGEDELGAEKVEDDEEFTEELKHFVSLTEDFKQCEQSRTEDGEGTGVDEKEDKPDDEGGDEHADEEGEDDEESAGGGDGQEVGRDGDGGRGWGEDQEECVGEGPRESEGAEEEEDGGMARGDVGLGVGREDEGRREWGRVSETRWMAEPKLDEGGVSLGSKVNGEGPGTGGSGLEGRIGQRDQMYRVRHDFKTEEQLYRYLSKFGDISDVGHLDGTEFRDSLNIPSDALVTYNGPAFKILYDNCPGAGITKIDKQQTRTVRMTDTAEFENITGMTGARLRRWDICDEDNLADMLNSVERGTKVTVWMKNRPKPFRAMWFTGQIDKVGDGGICLDYAREFRVDGVHRSVTSAFERIECKRIYLSSIQKITIERY